MTPQVTMRAFLSDLQLGGAILAGDSWNAWRPQLIAAMGERLHRHERRLFKRFTGRDREPRQRIEEAAFVIGRRGGKDRAASVFATYLSSCVDYSDVLVPGETGIVLCIAPDQKQAKITLDYIEANFRSSPVLAQLIRSRTADTLELSNNICVEVRAASFRRLRGPTLLAVIASEAAFWMSDELSANPDTEILNAVRPGLATTGGPLILISSPYARRGELWNTYRKHFGPAGDPLILVAQGASRDFNPTLKQRVVDRAMERDPASATAEYLAQFRSDLEQFVTREAVEACVDSGIREHPPRPGVSYFAAIDPAGGSGTDSMTLSIFHRDGDLAVMDCLRERRPKFSPDACVKDFVGVLKSYGITRVTGDHWGGDFVREPMRRLGCDYIVSDKAKSALYLDCLPAINSGKVSLLDNDRLVNQLCGLQRRTARSGRDSIDHQPGGHDDLATVCALGVQTALVRPKIEESDIVAPEFIPLNSGEGDRDFAISFVS